MANDKPRGGIYFCSCFKIKNVDDYIKQKFSTSLPKGEPEYEREFNRYTLWEKDKSNKNEQTPECIKEIISYQENIDNALRLSSCEIYTNKDSIGTIVTSYTLWDIPNYDVVSMSEYLCNKAWSWSRADNIDPSEHEPRAYHIQTVMTKLLKFIIDNPPNGASSDYAIDMIIPSDEINFAQKKYKAGQSPRFFKDTSDADSMGSSFIFAYFSAMGIDSQTPDKTEQTTENIVEEQLAKVLNNLEAAAACVHFRRYTPMKHSRENFSDRFYSMSMPTGESIVHRYKKLGSDESNRFFVPFVIALMSKIDLSISCYELNCALENKEEEKPENVQKAIVTLKKSKEIHEKLFRTISNNAAGKSIALQWLKKTGFIMILKETESICQQIITAVEGAKKESKDLVLNILAFFAIFSAAKDTIDLLGLTNNKWVTISVFIILLILTYWVFDILDTNIISSIKTAYKKLKMKRAIKKIKKKES